MKWVFFQLIITSGWSYTWNKLPCSFLTLNSEDGGRRFLRQVILILKVLGNKAMDSPTTNGNCLLPHDKGIYLGGD